MTFPRAAAALLLLALPASAHAQRMSKLTGEKLASICSNSKSKELCEAYLSGVADGIAGIEHQMPASQGKAFAGATCIPNATSFSSMRSTVLAYISDHPDLRDKPAAVSSFEALHSAFSCGSSN